MGSRPGWGLQLGMTHSVETQPYTLTSSVGNPKRGLLATHKAPTALPGF